MKDNKYRPTTVMEPVPGHPLPSCGVVCPDGLLEATFGRDRAGVSTLSLSTDNRTLIRINGVDYHLHAQFAPLGDGTWALQGKNAYERSYSLTLTRDSYRNTTAAAWRRAEAIAYAALMAVLEEHPELPRLGARAEWSMNVARMGGAYAVALGQADEARQAYEAALAQEPKD